MRLRKYYSHSHYWYIIDEFMINGYISTFSNLNLKDIYNTVKYRHIHGMAKIKINIFETIIYEIRFEELDELLTLIPEEFL